MWMIFKNGEPLCRGDGIDDTTSTLLLYAQRECYLREKLDAFHPTRIEYENGAYARHLTGNLYAVFAKSGRQIAVGDIDECDESLLVAEGDCARTRMEYPMGYSAIWYDFMKEWAEESEKS